MANPEGADGYWAAVLSFKVTQFKPAGGLATPECPAYGGLVCGCRCSCPTVEPSTKSVHKADGKPFSWNACRCLHIYLAAPTPSWQISALPRLLRALLIVSGGPFDGPENLYFHEAGVDSFRCLPSCGSLFCLPVYLPASGMAVCTFEAGHGPPLLATAWTYRRHHPRTTITTQHGTHSDDSKKSSSSGPCTRQETDEKVQRCCLRVRRR